MLREDQIEEIRSHQDLMTDADFLEWHASWKKATAKKAERCDETTIGQANAQELATFDATEAAAINSGRGA